MIEIEREFIEEKLEYKIHEYLSKHPTNSKLLILIDPFSFKYLLLKAKELSYRTVNQTPEFMGIELQCIETISETIIIQAKNYNDVLRDSWHLVETQRNNLTRLMNERT